MRKGWPRGAEASALSWLSRPFPVTYSRSTPCRIASACCEMVSSTVCGNLSPPPDTQEGTVPHQDRPAHIP
eukprot:2269176-Prymnesium_polylepis.1